MNKTKREYFAELRELAAENAELTAFIDHEVALLDKRNKAPKSPTKNQVENEKFREVVLANMGDRAMTCTEVQTEILGEFDLSPQRVSAVLTKMVREGQVVRIAEGRNVKFRLA